MNWGEDGLKRGDGVKRGDEGVKQRDDRVKQGDDGVKQGDDGVKKGEDGEAPASSSSAMRSMRGDSAGAMVFDELEETLFNTCIRHVIATRNGHDHGS